MSFLLSLLGFGRTLLNWGKANPLLAVIAVLVVGILWQHHEATSWRSAYNAEKAAYTAAVAAGQAAKAKAEITSHHDAEINNAKHETALVVARDAGDRYKQSHRVRYTTPVAAPGSEDSRAPVPAVTAADPLVVSVTDHDFDTCTDDHTYAVSAYQWAQKLIADGLAVPDTPGEPGQ